MMEKEFIEELEKINVVPTEKQLQQLEMFYKLLVEWNEKINLTSILEKKDVYLKHFYDSLTLVKAIDLKQDVSICDVGTGAGFPGIVLKIIFPNIKIILIDSLNKRINYLNEVIKKLDLKDIEAFHYRMEDYSKLNEEKFDYIVSRAVSNINVITEISIRALKVNGSIILMKANAKEELNSTGNNLKKLNAKINNVIEFKLPIEESNRTLIEITKVDKTPNMYPRRFDKIK